MVKIIEVLKHGNYLALAITSSLAFAAVYIYAQVLGITENVGLWLAVIPWYNAVLFVIFASLFGITLSFQVYNWRQPKLCSTGNVAGGAGAGGFATFMGFLVAQCPACASIGALFLPVSATVFLTQFSVVLNMISIGLLLFVINYLGGFRKE